MNKLLILGSFLLLSACATTSANLKGTGDLGVVIERADGGIEIVRHTDNQVLAKVKGLGDLSHASVVFSRDARYAYVFGRDGGLSKVDLLTATLEKRVIQAGNSIGGAISQDGKMVVAQNYTPGGIKAFDAETLELLADIPATYGDDNANSRVVGLVELPNRRFAYALFDAGEIRITDLSDVKNPKTQIFYAGKQPYDALLTPNGRYYIVGLFGEDGLALLDLWDKQPKVKKILAGYRKNESALPVYKMPHLRGWALAGNVAYLPAIGKNEVLAVDTQNWQEIARIPVKSQPVFVMARPDGREVWVNFAFPHNAFVQVISTQTQEVTHTLNPGRAILHMEFTPKGEAVWLSARDDNRVWIYDTEKVQPLQSFEVPSPSGIFFTTRALKMGL